MSPRIAALARALGVQPALWLGGDWEEGAGEMRPVRDPATGSELARMRLAGPADFTRAIDQAEAVFLRWRHALPGERASVLRSAADLLGGRRSELAELLTWEQGKPLVQAAAEVDYATSFFRWYADALSRLGGRIQPHPDPRRCATVDFVPAGVAGLITPWNFPLAQGAKKIAAALAAGCTAVWKPSEWTPLVALALGRLLDDAGLPAGALQVLPALGPIAGTAFTADPRLRVLSLTGSTETGRWLLRAATHLPRMSLELGGNAPFIVLPDADLELAAEDLIKLKLLCSGQVCVSANRVFVPAELQEAFCETLARRWDRLRVGHGLTRGVDAGPLIHDAACRRVRDLVDRACAGGARIVAENRSYASRPDHVVAGVADPGRAARPGSATPATVSGSFFPPLVLAGVRDEMAIAQSEIFGPVVALFSYATVAEAVVRANATPYGLAGYVYGTDVEAATAVAAALEVGITGVNEWRPLRADLPFGGWKTSGLGWEGGEEGLREFCAVKVVSRPRFKGTAGCSTAPG